MNCKKCGKEIPDGSKFCDGCGAKMAQENVKIQQSILDSGGTTIVKKKLTTGKIVLIAVFTVLIIIVIACAFGNDNSKTSDSESNIAQSTENIEQQIYDILNSTRVTDTGFYDTSIGIAVSAAFTNYEIEYTEFGSDKTYNVTISGTYIPNPEVSQYSLNGSITYLINLESKSCTIRSDYDNIGSVLTLYAVNYLN